MKSTWQERLNNHILGMYLTVGRHAALRGERLFSARYELSERNVQPASTGRTARAARTRLQAFSARAHACGKTGR